MIRNSEITWSVGVMYGKRDPSGHRPPVSPVRRGRVVELGGTVCSAAIVTSMTNGKRFQTVTPTTLTNASLGSVSQLTGAAPKVARRWLTTPIR